MVKKVSTQPLTAEAFAPYGDVLQTTGKPDKWINDGRCRLYRDLASMEFGGGRAGISLFDSEVVKLPYDLTFMERHPLGSQAFIPMTPGAFLVIVADDLDGTPVNVHAFITTHYQAINFHRHVWHGALAALTAPAIFTVVDRIGEEENLEIYRFSEIYRIS